MTAPYDFDADKREADQIIRRWVEAKTGTTDLQRWVWSTVNAFQSVGKKFQKFIKEFTK